MLYEVKLTQDKDALRDLYKRDIGANLYSVGDLDEPYFGSAQYFGAFTPKGELKAVLLKFDYFPPTNFIPHGDPDALKAIFDEIPRNKGVFRALCDEESLSLLPDRMVILSSVPFVRLIFRGNAAKEKDAGIMWLSENDFEAAKELFKYDSNAYIHKKALSNEHFLGIWREGSLVAIAGTNLLAQNERVAVIGRVITHPNFREEGYATRLIAQMVRDLSSMADVIGLQIEASDRARIALYKKLGFVEHSQYYNIIFRWK